MTAERVACNDATFRVANEGISDAANEYEVDDGLLPFICECADPRCTAVTQLTRAEYEEIRREPTHFLNIPGHEVNAQGHARVVSEHDRYVIVEKIGRAGELTEELDPRTGEEAADIA